MKRTALFVLVASICLPAMSLPQDGTRETRYQRSDGDELIVRSGATGYQPSGPAPDFGQLDHDGNGYISVAEARGHALLANDFKMADANRDGRISAAEYARWKGSQ